MAELEELIDQIEDPGLRRQFASALITVEQKGTIRRLDLTDEQLRNKVRQVTSNVHLKQLFDGA